MRKHPLLALATAVLIISGLGAMFHARPATATSVPHRPAAGTATHLVGAHTAAPGRDHASTLRGRVAFGHRLPSLDLAYPGETPLALPASQMPLQPAVNRIALAWLALRACESNDDYRADTGNGYYGAYQFAPETWWSVGERGLPNEAPAPVQDAAAEQLLARDGRGAWPRCGAALDLS